MGKNDLALLSFVMIGLIGGLSGYFIDPTYYFIPGVMLFLVFLCIQ